MFSFATAFAAHRSDPLGSGANGLPGDTLAEIWFGDAADYDYAAAPNLRASTTPTGNIFIYTSDQVRAQGGTPTITYNYDGNGGTRVQLTGTQTLNLVSASAPGSSTLNGQNCTVGFQWMPTGGTTQSIRFGQSTNYGAVSATGGTFSQTTKTWSFAAASAVVITTLANSTIQGPGTPGASRVSNVTTFKTSTAHSMIAGQSVVVTGVTDTSFNGTFTIIDVPTSDTFTVSNAGSNATSGTGTVAKPVDIVVKELQLYEGTTLPAYSTENWDYHFKSNWAIPTALSMTGEGLNNVAPAVSRGAIVFPERATYDDITVFVVASKSSVLTTNGALLTPIYDPDSSPIVSSTDFNMASAVTTGFFYVAPQSATQETGRIVMQDAGIQIYGFRGNSTQVTAYLNELQAMQSTTGTGWGPHALRGFWLGAYAATRNQSPTASLFDGLFYMFAMVPRALSDAEMVSAMGYIRTEAASRGVSLGTLSDITIAGGDSLTEWISVPTWPWVLTADATISPRMQLKNCANGGSSFNGITSGQATAFGTVLVNEIVPAIQACDAMGTTPIVMLLDGANDYAFLSTLAGAAPPDPVTGWNNALAGWENYRDIWWIPYMQAVRAASPNVKIIGLDTLPRGDAAAIADDFEVEGRTPWNTWKRANYATYCDAYVSLSGTNLDDFATADGLGYYSADDLHLSATGQAYLASLIKPVWASVR
jgi:hypothetical protein